MDNRSFGATSRFLILAGILQGLTACGGTKMLKEPEPLVATQSIASAADQGLSVTLDWIIVRDGPGTWAKNVDWDEYIIQVQNRGNGSLEITDIAVLDSLGAQIGPGESRKQLVKGTRETKRRYKGEGLTVNAGAGATTLMMTGAVTYATAMSVGSAAMLGSSAMAGAAVTGLALAPVLAVGGVFRAVNNSKVGNQIESRQTLLPIPLHDDREKGLHVFFPLTPSPRQIEVTYIDALGTHTLIVDTQAALDGLHLAKEAE